MLLLQLAGLGVPLGLSLFAVGARRPLLSLKLPGTSLMARLKEGMGECRQEDGIPRLHGGRGDPREGLGRRRHVTGLPSGQTAPVRARHGASSRDRIPPSKTPRVPALGIPPARAQT